MIRQYSSFIVFLLVCYTSVLANDNQLDVFKAANQLYEKGEYLEAKVLYQGLIDEDYISDDLHFNLANTHFKTNQIALAILHYHKALKINPNNKDAAYNLKLANQKTIDKVEDIPELFIYRWWKAVYNLFPADYWAKLTIISLFLSIICFGIFLFANVIFLRKTGFYIALSTFGLAILFWFLASRQNLYMQSSESAIIMSPTVNIVSAPSEGSSQLFVLHEGTKVKIIDENETWMKISLPNGNEGWLLKSKLRTI